MKCIFVPLFVCQMVGFGIPPKTMPKHLVAEYTMNGTIPVKNRYRNDSYSSEKAPVYSQSEISKNIQKVKSRKCGYYGNTDLYLYAAMDKYASRIKGKSVGIIGSTIPWYESIVLAYGGRPVTIEYNKIVSEVPELKTMTVDEYRLNPCKFDVILSISSFEHDGLGRYGDPLDPNGDLRAMKETKAMLNDGGILLLAVPVGKDMVVWNLHRVYGNKRLPLLLKGWRGLDTFGLSKKDFNKDRSYHQPVFVLTPEV